MNKELDIETIRQSPRQFVDLETVIALSDRCEVLEADADEVNAARIYLREKGRLLTDLAASQAREVRLRETFTLYWERGLVKEFYDAVGVAIEAIKGDTSTLEAMIAKAGEVMREMAATVCDKRSTYSSSVSVESQEARDCAFNIRALPGVTLDDIK